MSSQEVVLAPQRPHIPSSSRQGPAYPFYLGGTKGYKQIISLPGRECRNKQLIREHLLLGIATSLAGTMTHPLDLVASRLQTMDPKPGMTSAMISCVKTKGIQGLFEGLSATWFRGMTYSLVRFWTYEQSKAELVKRSKNKKSTPSIAIASGAVAGVIGGAVSNPGDIVLIRMQAESSKVPSQRYGYSNVLHGLYKIVADEGVGALFKGLNVTISRAVLTNCGQLASYDLAKEQLLKMDFPEGAGCHFVASFISGTVGTTVSQPADVVRSRLMAAGAGEQRISTIVKQLLRQEGPQALFRGFVPTWSRQTPQTVFTFMILEQLKRLVDYQTAG
ncbi:putative DIC1-mitochondrial dicarboxylate carrier protein [Meredithblackwellia eburnea MCA 4105]